MQPVQPVIEDHIPLNGGRRTDEALDTYTDVMVSRSLRLPSYVFDELTAIAAEQGMAWSTLIRQWVIEGIAAARRGNGREVDPAVDLQRGVELINSAAARLR